MLRTRSALFLALLIALASGRHLQAAQAFVVADAKTGYVLQAQEPQQKRQVGSLTKIATAMVVLDWAERSGGDLNESVILPPEAFAGISENLIGFQPGDVISLRDLLYAALVQSDNIAANTLAQHVGRKLTSVVPAQSGDSHPVSVFVGQMNALAKQLRMERTRFMNPTGMDAKEKPYSTATDMARLTRYAVQKASFRFYVSQKNRQISFQRAGRPQGYQLRNTNELLGVNGIDGVKTGRTARAGDCLILSAHRDSEIVKDGARTIVTPRHLIVVMLGSPNRFGEGSQLLAQGWSLYEQWAAAGRPADPKKLL